MQKKSKMKTIIYFIEIMQVLVLILFLFLYKGIFMVGGFIALSLCIIIFTYRLFRHENVRWFKTRAILILLIAIVIFVILLFSRPTYTFNDGKSLVYNHFLLDEEYEYKVYEIGHNTIPSNYEEINAFHSNRLYYYRFFKNDEYRYFIVEAMSGVVMEIGGEYWDNID